MWETDKALLLFLTKKISLVKLRKLEQRYNRLTFVYLALNKYIKTFYKFDEGVESVSIKLQSEVNAHLMNVVSLFYEV